MLLVMCSVNSQLDYTFVVNTANVIHMCCAAADDDDHVVVDSMTLTMMECWISSSALPMVNWYLLMRLARSLIFIRLVLRAH